MNAFAFSSHNNLRSPRNPKEPTRERESHKDSRERKTGSQHPAVSTSSANNGTSSTTDRAFKDKHHPLLIAIWNTDRTQTNIDEKLKGLRDLFKKGTSTHPKKNILHHPSISFSFAIQIQV